MIHRMGYYIQKIEENKKGRLLQKMESGFHSKVGLSPV